ncbi:MAG: heat-inducible transcription repressor HrcA [Chloroflexi bacterium]|jgi:heat-inducible transcriptional repressor|nr:heat-inducible transcription repressor HrcA [Chloroflexota bacterium]MBT5318382.1 heat-inducible transcription repressor HrcA [Chloroflexota bacterium]MBT6682926.1 heat-inducible transcription repressor HrcA [Chloroflexota bacterium]
MTTLSPRRGSILKLIVDGYIATGEPVASSVVASDLNVRVSPATVRNEMVSLEDDGYITRPHSSAGGIPADKGYRFIVEGLESTPNEPAAHDFAAIQAALERRRRDMEEWADAAASIVAGLLKTLAFASAPRADASRIKQLDLLLMQDLTAMLVLILHETTVVKQLIPLESPTTQDELYSVRNRLHGTVAGRTADEITRQIGTSDTGHGLESVVLDSTVSALRERDQSKVSGYNIEGLGRLLGTPELSQDNYGVALTELLDSDDALYDLSEGAPSDGTAVVYIGEEIPRAEFSRCSVIVARYGVPSEASGVVGLIGPTRLAYQRAVPVVETAATLLGDLVTEAYYGYPVSGD